MYSPVRLHSIGQSCLCQQHTLSHRAGGRGRRKVPLRSISIRNITMGFLCESVVVFFFWLPVHTHGGGGLDLTHVGPLGRGSMIRGNLFFLFPPCEMGIDRPIDLSTTVLFYSGQSAWVGVALFHPFLLRSSSIQKYIGQVAPGHVFLTGIEGPQENRRVTESRRICSWAPGPLFLCVVAARGGAETTKLGRSLPWTEASK